MDKICGDNECFPKLGERRLGASGPSIPKDEDHAPATIIERSFIEEFNNIELPEINFKTKFLLWCHKNV